ncbi:MAG: B12-binding domain-containing radical SAM protein [Thermodesulfobacteriota bacterium]
MPLVLLLQLPIPQINYGLKTGNIPLAAACLKLAGGFSEADRIAIFPESRSAYLGDAALIREILAERPDTVGFTVFNWNIRRSLYLAEKLKDAGVARIVLGGPEITPDNPILAASRADHLVVGPGEAAFRGLLGLREPDRGADEIFSASPSPYISGLLEPHIDDLVYFESQRGCPHRCAFCYYHKSRDNLVFVRDELVLATVQWALDQGISELCLLDPSLNIRPGLKSLLKKIAGLNRNKRLSLNAEIRAEAVGPELAGLFAAAGFTGFEIGLQSVTPKALAVMQRATDPNRFLKGVNLLKERGILPRIDLIVGLPGDTLQGFRNSLAFVKDNRLDDDIQVFPLSVLPGTVFRRNSPDLGLAFEPEPPYTVISTPDFSSDDIYQAFEEAEEQLDVALFPAPHLNICLRPGSARPEDFFDLWVKTGAGKSLHRLVLHPGRALAELETLSGELTHPYQLLLPRIRDWGPVAKSLAVITRANPFTPLEIIAVEPAIQMNPAELLSSIHLKRPHYLDNDLRFLHQEPGNRAVLFTLVSTLEPAVFRGEMQRQVFWWRAERLPESGELESLGHLDGILIDCSLPEPVVHQWQDRTAEAAPDLPAVCFAHDGLQRRWLSLTMADQYYMASLTPWDNA